MLKPELKNLSVVKKGSLVNPMKLRLEVINV